MNVINPVMWSVHVGFAVLWVGSVLFVTLAVLPPALRGEIGTTALGSVAGRLRWITRISAVAFVLSGGHMAGTLYTFEALTGTPRGHLVLTMLGLWFVGTGLVEVAGSKLADGLDADKLREPAREAKPFLYGASAVSLGLIVTAGLLASPSLL
ncbi:transporter [Halorubrum sp. Atlit-8R]|uniref:transporter n=1 Tax=unclassified Halorubrum TaxID=2642239 RepID=UPI000EF23600|nr:MULTISPECIES: transporter [unclassified Halorubrum]RLM71297.1 transporter [Halorubrum sp. Atlit-9R]RLM72165.1 transporter [Halorubrum sp. Atlit-9R]RLM82550.1 transporter [Halorubrum sp. Atlit-8R]